MTMATDQSLPKKIAVLMGGPGSERDVSLATGRGVSKALRSLGAEVIDVDVHDENFALPKDVDLAFKMRGQAVQSAVGRPAGLTSVGDFKAQIGRPQFLGQQRRISLSRSQAEPLRQAIAENEDPFHR